MKGVGPCDDTDLNIFLSLLFKPKDARAARGLPSDCHRTWVTVRESPGSHTQHAGQPRPTTTQSAVSSFGDTGASCCPAGTGSAGWHSLAVPVPKPDPYCRYNAGRGSFRPPDICVITCSTSDKHTNERASANFRIPGGKTKTWYSFLRRSEPRVKPPGDERVHAAGRLVPRALPQLGPR